MLTFYILNVGHGDSTVIKYDGPDGPQFGVIDSNRVGQIQAPALTKLLACNAQELAFVALTHPHKDHFLGLSQVLTHYTGKIGSFYSYPLHSHSIGRVAKLAKMYKKLCEEVDSPVIRSAIKELLQILIKAKELNNDWEEPVGMKNLVSPPGFRGVEISVLLPFKKERGWFFKAIDDGRTDLLKPTVKENQLSLAFQFKYAGHEIVIGGDGTYLNWVEHKRLMERGDYSLKSTVVRLPHHGSKDDCKSPVLDYLFGKSDVESTRYACISANGHSHPHPDIYKELQKLGVLPYCTNLAEQCGATLRELIKVPEVTPVLERLINMTAEQPTERAIQPCQGDITVQINPAGHVTVTPQHNHPCPYRGGYSFFDGLTDPNRVVH